VDSAVDSALWTSRTQHPGLDSAQLQRGLWEQHLGWSQHSRQCKECEVWSPRSAKSEVSEVLSVECDVSSSSRHLQPQQRQQQQHTRGLTVALPQRSLQRPSIVQGDVKLPHQVAALLSPVYLHYSTVTLVQFTSTRVHLCCCVCMMIEECEPAFDMLHYRINQELVMN